ncbi:cupin domain-containing protein [Conexibacter stalactiti]|uniref:Cupin domain-containing protein n=1 Tax=Conexibacter stalactiti TaxID=1940611 RepID=A0ABU4HJ55_9ACTN|nr:cupin domain-containing protein [Conexibacter stalactiti]MDW5593350.1 cupin domain-containing protein [Conexibacter stalactiti]MEC5033991.1 cupin domain-containing protein [Conexibacter stalactiti]
MNPLIHIPTDAAADVRHASWTMDALVIDLLTGAESADACAQQLHVMARGFATPLHRHTNEDELFHLIEGELTLFGEDGESTLRAGESAFLPRGRAHAFTVRSQRAQLLVTITPAGFDRFFHAVGEAAPERDLPPAGLGTLGPEALGAILAEYGVAVEGPPQVAS